VAVPVRSAFIDSRYGAVSQKSNPYSLARFDTAIGANECPLSRVDHADGALEISVSLDATTLLMFGSRPRQAALVKALRLIALELPFTVLSGRMRLAPTCVSYTDCRWLATRYAGQPDDVCLLSDTAVMIDGIARKAASPP
jgi:hypothetical protein